MILMAAGATNSFSNSDILSISQFTPSLISHVFDRTNRIIKLMKTGGSLDILKGRVITLLFFEPSSRTFASFSSAAKRLGGQTIDIQDPTHTSSWVKGESYDDTIKVYETYSDALIIRHSQVGAVAQAAKIAQIPVINAGDGVGEHPTQALLDLYTIHQKFGALEGLSCVAAGDPKHSRTIRSLAQGLALYPKNTLYLLSAPHLRISPSFREELRAKGLRIIEIDRIEDIPKGTSVWYWNRIQKERFESEAEYKKSLGSLTLTQEILDAKGSKDLIILDPLPRVEEIDPGIDTDPRALYLTNQIKNGLYVRMAVLSLVLGKSKVSI